MPGNLLSPVGPSPIYCFHGDAIIVGTTYWNLPATTTVYVFYRMLVNGQRQEYSSATQVIPTNGLNDNFTNSTIQLPEGWLLGVSIVGGSAGLALQQGILSVQVGLCRGVIGTLGNIGSQNGAITLNAQSATIPLISGGLTNYPLTWPYIGAGNPVSQPGYLSSIAVGNPAASTNLSYALATAGLSTQRNTIQNIRFTLVNSAAAGNRQVQLLFTDASANVYFSVQAQVTQPASQTNTYNFSPGVGPNFTGAATAIVAPAGADILVPLPAVLQMNDNTTISTVIANIQTGDQISATVLRLSTQHERD